MYQTFKEADYDIEIKKYWNLNMKRYLEIM